MNKKGFTLVEVLLGMMILTVAIVMASNLYMAAMKSNRVMTLNLRAYYMAQEGLELTRNIRDTHWLHNLDWLRGKGNGGNLAELEKEKTYTIKFNGKVASAWEEIDDINGMSGYLPWEITEGPGSDLYNDSFLVDNGAIKFYRHIDILPYEKCGENKDEDCGGDFALIQSVVNFEDGGRENEVMLEEVLTNWKKGVM